ncbi:hypothetical protein [Verminephrobacter aporrectodeae]|uniref:hypothetical protein n=1 Tax=Verminephrobacter aporrectodeae TaxID=1110389 RepID=UPI002243C2AF|nr:hypothetical protein [Verminephrobacter aporrectodeae]
MANVLDVSQTQQERLVWELRAFFAGELQRGDIEAQFGIRPAAASRDLSLYRDIAPGNLDYRRGPALLPSYDRLSSRYANSTSRTRPCVALARLWR